MKRLGQRCLLSLIAGIFAVLILAPTGAFPGEPVHFKQLLPFVELKLPQWEMSGKPSGTTVKHESISMSEAKASYHAGEKTLEVVVLDFMGQHMPWMAMLPQMEMENDGETIRSTTISGFKALETFKSRDKRGELNISVADRFWVKLEGEGIDNTEPLKAAAGQMDLKKLATLVK